MNDGEPKIPDGEAPAGGSSRAPGRGPGDGTRPRTFLGDTRRDVGCGVCRITLQLGYRAVRFPCGQGRLGLRACWVVEALARVAAPAQLRCQAINSGGHHPRRDALDAAVQTYSGLRDRATRMGRRIAGDEDLRSRGVWYGGWDQNSLGIGPPLDAVFLEDMGQRLSTGQKVQSQLAGAHTYQSVQVQHPQPRHGRAPAEHGRRTRSYERSSPSRSYERSSCDTSCRPCSAHQTAGSRDDRGSRWWRAGT